MQDLFSREPEAPWATLLRPQRLDDVVGQQHLLGPGRPLRRMLESGRLKSFILWGPPGVGKTTIARLSAQHAQAELISLSAVLDGVKEIRDAVSRAQTLLDRDGRAAAVFIDEIHRFNKAQQDALLPHVESGLLKLIGATTENATMAVNSALLSRCQVYRLLPLQAEDLRALYERARVRMQAPKLDEQALALVIHWADSDARRMLNFLEQLQAVVQDPKAEIGEAFVRSALAEPGRRFDHGDVYYDLLSALQKSIRGSSPDGALYWLARLLDGGADGRVVARRLMVMASEEVGAADPQALQVATSAALVYERVGSPEGDLALAHAALHIACAPKSNAVYKAWKQAAAFVAKDKTREVPLHLRNAPTRLMQEMGFHEGYRYAHDEPEGYAAGEVYLPEELPAQNWYVPTNRGQEFEVLKRVRRRAELDAQSPQKRRP